MLSWAPDEYSVGIMASAEEVICEKPANGTKTQLTKKRIVFLKTDRFILEFYLQFTILTLKIDLSFVLPDFFRMQ